MNRITKTLGTLFAGTLLFTACGQNPLGDGAPGGMSLFAKLGKAISKPSAVNDEENGKEGSKAVVTNGIAQAKRLAKMAGTAAEPAWMISRGIEARGGDTLVYFEVVSGKPDESESLKKKWGRGEVAFKYSGTYTSLSTFNSQLISDVYSWKFVGRELKEWKSEVCSLRATVNFSEGNLQIPETIKPGFTEFWAKNISISKELGEGDTAYFSLDSLDDINHVQFGKGRFLDAYTGKDNNGPATAFNFDLQILHKNTLNASLPYLRYEDNEAIMNFSYPWGNSGDYLYFTVHFYPDEIRKGNIRKNSATGPILAEFTGNDKDGSSTTTYYDEDGNVIGQE